MAKTARLIAGLIAAGLLAACGDSGGKVVFSELMYRPVAESGGVDDHEFLEIHNPGHAKVSLGGWHIGGDVRFTFPADATLGPGEYRVVARNPTALAKVGKYRLSAEAILGPYEGELDNGGGKINLSDAAGARVDTAAWDDKFPWPHAADAFGAGENWFPPRDTRARPMDHQHMGVSLERVELGASGVEAANWEPSAIDEATPGRARAGDPVARPIVEAQIARAEGVTDSQVIRPMQKVVVAVEFTRRLRHLVRSARLEYFVDELGRTDEPRASAPLAAAPQDGIFRATLDGQSGTKLVRYRILANRGAGAEEVVSPRPSDPYQWYAFFVEPAVQTRSKQYHLWVEPRDWGHLYVNIGIALPGGTDLVSGQRRVVGALMPQLCIVRPEWDDRVPASLISEGRVFDVRVRFAGSRWNRPNGAGRGISADQLPMGPVDGSGRRYATRALSWNISLPRYRSFDGGVRTIILNKLNQACPGINNVLADKLYSAVDVPASRFKGYARVHVNGSYYHYMMDVEHPDETMIARYVKKGDPIGELYKSEGSNTTDEGPWGWSDGRALPAFCNQTPSQRYAASYDRTDDDGRVLNDVEKLINEHVDARMAAPLGADVTPLREFFLKNFDVELLTRYVAVRNWSAAWDDNVHNFFLWKRGTDGKWVMFGWDFDLEFGQFIEPQVTAPYNLGFFMGRQNRPGMGNEFTNRTDTIYNTFKDSFIRAFESELVAKIKELSTDLLTTAKFNRLVDEAEALYDLPEAMAAPAGIACTVANNYRRVRMFGELRPIAVRTKLPP